MSRSRVAELTRTTRETSVQVKLDLDGNGSARLNTGIKFLDHMLGAFALHGLFDLEVTAEVREVVDEHHVVEDVGIALGQLIDKALGDKRGIRRFGSAIVPMDDSLVLVAVDLSGRGYSVIKVDFKRRRIGDLPTELIPHFLESLAINGKFNLHVLMLYGKEDHHEAEAIFKALGLALREAVRLEPGLKGKIPSQKGLL